MFRPTKWSSSGLHQNMSLVAVHILGSQCVLQLAKFRKLQVVKCSNTLLSLTLNMEAGGFFRMLVSIRISNNMASLLRRQ
jgi:hypothetical protein